MPSSIHLVEPFPSYPSSYAHTGRGGAGNISAGVSDRTNASRNQSAASALSSLSSRQTPAHTGRGGAGNTSSFSGRAMFSFDEELARLRRAEDSVAPVYHIGRGGQGNLVHGSESSRRDSDASTVSSDSDSRAKRSLEWVRDRFSRSSSK